MTTIEDPEENVRPLTPAEVEELRRFLAEEEVLEAHLREPEVVE